VPQGFVDGVNVNKKATADYFAKDPKGVQELAAAKTTQEAQLAAGKVPKAASTPTASVQPWRTTAPSVPHRSNVEGRTRTSALRSSNGE